MTQQEWEQAVDAALVSLRRDLVAAGPGSVEFRVDGGMVKRENWNTGWIEAEPTEGRTITIEIKGGARVERGEPIR